MAILKIIPGEYLNPDALEKLIHGYVFRKALRIGGFGVDPECAAEQMHTVKRYWNQTHGKQLHHFVLSFNQWESKEVSSSYQLMLGAYDVCQYYADEYQIVFGLHRPASSTNWHIHFVVNNVNFVTGARLPDNIRQDYMLRDYMLACYLPSKQITVCYD